MPTSLVNLSPLIVHHVWEVWRDLDRPIRVLDVGPGFGRYGLLCRELVDGPERGTRLERLDAIEAEPRYRELFPWVEHIYDVVFDGDAADPALAGLYGPGEFVIDGEDQGPDNGYDLVLMLDVIEHMEEAAAIALLDAIPGRVLISTPRDFFDNPEADEGWPTERHRSHFPTPASFGPAALKRIERTETASLKRWGANIVRLGTK